MPTSELLIFCIGGFPSGDGIFVRLLGGLNWLSSDAVAVVGVNDAVVDGRAGVRVVVVLVVNLDGVSSLLLFGVKGDRGFFLALWPVGV